MPSLVTFLIKPEMALYIKYPAVFFIAVTGKYGSVVINDFSAVTILDF